MIKKDPIEVLTAKIDKLTTTVERLVDGLIKQAPVRKPYTKRVPVKAVERVRRYKQFPHELYASLTALAVGEQVNITAFVRSAGIPLPNVKKRISHWAWLARQQNGSTVNYETVKQGWDIFVKRTV